MKWYLTTVLLIWGLCSGANAPAQEKPDDAAPRHAISVDFFHSGDADDNYVYQPGINLDLIYRGPEKFFGIRLEHAGYWLSGRPGAWQRWRSYLRYADKNDQWAWNIQAGSDGRTLIGAASVHNNDPFRMEYFIDRDIVQTPMGVDRGIYYTFAGGAFDLPINARNQFVVLGGVQKFTGSNTRLHVRATYIYELMPDLGLSFQIRSRYFHDSRPHEYDYYSPGWHAEILPVLQISRYMEGWRSVVAAGLGLQRDSDSSWRQLRFVRAELTSPIIKDGWFFKGAAQYSNMPLATGIYNYWAIFFSVGKVF
jgi:hypothetical protein